MSNHIDMVTCSLCKTDHYVIEDPRGYCENCERKYPLTEHAPLGEAPRPVRPCRACGHGVLIRCRLQTRIVDGEDARALPLAATFTREVKRKRGSYLANGRTTYGPLTPEGIFEAYVCKRCGFTDVYATDPGRIPIGPEYGTEEVRVGGESPYR